MATRNAVLPTLLILILLSLAVSATPSWGASVSYFSENLLGFVDDDGRAYVAALFLDSEMSVGGVDLESPDVEGLMAAVLVTQDGILDALPDVDEMSEGFDMSSIQNLVPPTALVMAYVDVSSEVAGERAEGVSSSFSDAFGTRLSQLISFSSPLPVEGREEGPRVSIVVYQSPEELGEMAEAYLSLFPIESGGLVEVVEEAHATGRLIPSTSPESADGAVLFAGFINLDILGRYVPLDEIDKLKVSHLILPPFEGPLGLCGGASYWESGAQSPPQAHSFDLLSLLGVEFPVSFSSEADLSNLLLIAPNQTMGEDVGEQRAIKLVTTAPQMDPQFEEMIQDLAQRMTVTVMPRGSTLDPSSFQVTFSALLPLNVQVSKEVTPQASTMDGEVRVTVTVRNNDDYPMENVVLDDGGTVLGYQMNAAITSGSTEEAWSLLQPGESRTLTYTLRLSRGGVYTLRPATVQYVYEGEAFSASSDPAEVRVSYSSAPAFVAESVAASWSATARALDTFTKGNGSNILLASTLAWIVVLAFVEYRAFRKWLAGG